MRQSVDIGERVWTQFHCNKRWASKPWVELVGKYCRMSWGGRSMWLRPELSKCCSSNGGTCPFTENGRQGPSQPLWLAVTLQRRLPSPWGRQFLGWETGNRLTEALRVKGAEKGITVGSLLKEMQTKNTRMTTWSSSSTPVHLCRQNYHSKGYMPPAFTAALFTRAKTCPLADEWIKNTWYIHTMEHSSAIKIMSSAATCTQLAIIIWSTSGREKQTTHDITYMWHLNLWFHEPTCETDWRSY